MRKWDQLCWSIAHQIKTRPNYDLDDLVQVCRIALLKSIDNFDLIEYAHITSLATIARKAMLRQASEYANRDKTVMPPRDRLEKYHDKIMLTRSIRSLSDVIPGCESKTYSECIFYEDTADAEFNLDVKLNIERIMQAVTELPPRYRGIINSRLAGQTLQQIGDKLGISKERIRQLEAKAITRIQRLIKTCTKLTEPGNSSATMANMSLSNASAAKRSKH
jgi:RNA polymerase sigma factor (sigma-70 family)